MNIIDRILACIERIEKLLSALDEKLNDARREKIISEMNASIKARELDAARKDG